MARTGHRRSRTFRATLLALFSATALAGCQQKAAELNDADLMSTSSTAPVSYQATADLGKAWQSDPSSISKGIAYANALERLGQDDKQLEVDPERTIVEIGRPHRSHRIVDQDDLLMHEPGGVAV